MVLEEMNSIILFFSVCFLLPISILFCWEMAVHCLRNKRLEPGPRSAWFAFIALGGLIGALAYYFVIKKPALKKDL